MLGTLILAIITISIAQQPYTYTSAIYTDEYCLSSAIHETNFHSGQCLDDPSTVGGGAAMFSFLNASYVTMLAQLQSCPIGSNPIKVGPLARAAWLAQRALREGCMRTADRIRQLWCFFSFFHFA